MNDSLPGFNGERPDPICGVTHLGNGYRAYHPLLMRFTCPDDLSPFGAGGINPYAYCVGDPINRADPSGHVSAGSLFGILAGVIWGVMLGVFTAGLALPATLAIDAAFTVAVTGAAMGIDHQRLSSMSGEDWGVLISGSVLASVGGAIAGKVLGSLKGARGRPFGGLMMEGDSSLTRMIRHGAIINYNPEYQVHTLGFAARGTVEGHRFSSAITGPDGVIKINIHGLPGMVSLASKYGGDIHNTVRAADFIQILNHRVPGWRNARSVELLICYSADGNEESVMSAVLDNIPKGVTVTGIRGVGRVKLMTNLERNGRPTFPAEILDHYEISNNWALDDLNRFIAAERKRIPSGCIDPFILHSPDAEISDNNWVQTTRL